MSVTRKEDARARGTCLRASSRGQLRSPEMESLLAGYANSFSLCTGYLCTAKPRIVCLLALSSYLENIIPIRYSKYSSSSYGEEENLPHRLASQPSLASFWGFLIPLAGKSVPLATETIHYDFCCKILPVKAFTVGTPRKRPPPVSDRDHFLGLTVKHFPLFLTSCKRPLDAFSDPYFR